MPLPNLFLSLVITIADHGHEPVVTKLLVLGLLLGRRLVDCDNLIVYGTGEGERRSDPVVPGYDFGSELYHMGVAENRHIPFSFQVSCPVNGRSDHNLLRIFGSCVASPIPPQTRGKRSRFLTRLDPNRVAKRNTHVFPVRGIPWWWLGGRPRRWAGLS
ncbi:hypothetical protein BC938DRAFT_481814 [Jimgerdemannia flammicorona]|uniref:Uncharacterized protein n=1 Tax=Jimgerdemannia flammicorona TaxID=994334 RepID=A0A433QFC7_9FUNG|nr:hypothetical protein BC938DRAFT_481814 [Jimgerdemannia flammicorona]